MITRELTRGAKAVVERTLGVTISRTAPPPPNKHADHALRQLRAWSSSDVVFDVGANDGRTILRIQEQLASPRIFAFEPVASTYRMLVSRTQHLPNVRAFHCGLGAEARHSPIYLNEIHEMNSLSPRWTAGAVATETVEISTVDRVMAEEGVEFVHFLKIDTEGHELEVLRGAEEALRGSRIGIVQVEVGVGQVDKSFLSLEDARRHLAARGYLLYGIYNQCLTRARTPAAWTADAGPGAPFKAEVLSYCDAVFLRADR